MIAELVIPDDADRYIYSAVLETVSGGHGTQHLAPREQGMAGMPAERCPRGISIRSATERKNSATSSSPARKIPLCWSRTDALAFRAAVCEINIYAVKGGLPALKIPKTDRTYANHNERLIFNAWGSYGKCRSPTARRRIWCSITTAPGSPPTGRLHGRSSSSVFRDNNASVEGAFMYENGVFSSRHAQTVLNNDRFDYYHALPETLQAQQHQDLCRV